MTMADTITQPTRAEAVRQERRRKPGSVSHSGIKLAVDERKLDRNTYSYRFVKDVDGRVQQLEADDYDIAPEGAKPDGNGLGTVSSAMGGTNDGKPYNMVLMRKRKDWFEADQKAKQKPLDEMDEAIRRGADHKTGKSELRGEGVYTPGTNSIDSDAPSGVSIKG
jgi:hypothetical protein